VPCKRCGNQVEARAERVASFERISLADDPADPNVGHYYIDVVYVMRCPSCGHRQEQVTKRSPFSSLSETQRELEGHLIGKG
jgi:DNA-directed RNA polymerase subunit RPC12/RpoP